MKMKAMVSFSLIVLANLLLTGCEAYKNRCYLMMDEGEICKTYDDDDEYDDHDCDDDYDCSEERWYFDHKSQNCKAFDYKGCGGNANNFDTKEDCAKTCHAPPTCEQPPYTGNCRAAIPRFYYDPEHGDCKKFTYGGCGGNDNNFKTIEECRKACKKTPLPTCEQPLQPGPCYGNFLRYYYNSESEKCESFVYGGCDGNQNNFKTKAACEKKCCEDTSTTPIDICKLPSDQGPCDKYTIRYFYNTKSRNCEFFIYGGCKGNGNNFRTKTECEQKCKDGEVNPCDQPKVVGPCKGYFPRYFYNKKSKKCEQFIYGGCRGNGNNFENKNDCEKACAAAYYCPSRLDMYCVQRLDQCCSDKDCPSGQLCCNENCGNTCRKASHVPTDGTKVEKNGNCKIDQ